MKPIYLVTRTNDIGTSYIGIIAPEDHDMYGINEMKKIDQKFRFIRRSYYSLDIDRCDTKEEFEDLYHDPELDGWFGRGKSSATWEECQRI